MSDYNECLELFKAVFGEEDAEFRNCLFDDCFEYCRYFKAEGKVVSMVFALPCEVKTEKSVFDAFYIYAAATSPRFRGKGYMKALLGKLQKDFSKILFLRPAEESLISYYKKINFKEIKAKKGNELPLILPLEGFGNLCKKFPVKADNSEYIAMYSGKNTELKEINFLYTYE